MLNFWGPLSVLAMTVLPGLALLPFVPRLTGPSRIFFVFYVTVAFNYLLMFLGAQSELLSTTLVRIVYLVLLILAVLSVFRRIQRPPDWIQRKLEVINPAELLAVIGLLFMVNWLGNETGTVFRTWDAVMSWNKWATEWGAGKIPESTWHYPQLLPANWGLSYLINGWPWQFTAKLFNPLHFFIFCFYFVRRGFQENDSSKLVFFILLALVFGQVIAPSVVDGYSDAGVAMICFAAFISLEEFSVKRSESSGFSLLLFSGFLAGLAPSFKQVGFMVLPVWFLILFFQRPTKREIVGGVVSLTVSLLFISLPFYLYAQYLISIGKNATELVTVTSAIHGDRTYWQRLLHAVGLLQSEFRWYLLILAVGAVFSRPSFTQKLVLLFFALPICVLWCFLFSYDIRNVAIAIPPVVYLSANGWAKLLEKIRWRPRFQIPSKIWAPFSGILILFLASLLLVPTGFSSQYQEEKLHEIGNKGVNSRLYKYFENFKDLSNVVVLTHYQFLNFLPKLKTTRGDLNPPYDSAEQLKSDIESVGIGKELYVLTNSDEPIYSMLNQPTFGGHIVHSIWVEQNYQFFKINF